MGTGAAGVRVDGTGNTLIVPKETEIHADGPRATGLMVTYGSGHTVEQAGTVTALGEGGTGVRFDFGSSSNGARDEYRGSYIRYIRTVQGRDSANPGAIGEAKNLPLSDMDADTYNANKDELKGALHGLFRVRCFTQDDAHIFMRREQITDEIIGVVNLINEVYSKFGFKYFVELSTRPEDSMGSDEDWKDATNGLIAALEKLNMPYKINEGDGAFYGPKIDFHLEDSLGRTWQCGTVQLDFQMPLNFELEYIDEKGSRQRPIMVHRVCFGSIERFIGILTEHYAGKFPVWLSPIQVKILTLPGTDTKFAREVYIALSENKIRCKLDDRNEKIGYKIREARQIDKVPYMIIIGQKEIDNNMISVRNRDTDKTTSISLDEFLSKIKDQIKNRI